MCVILAVQDVFLALASGPAVDITFLWGCYCCVCVMNISPSHQKTAKLHKTTLVPVAVVVSLFSPSQPFPAGASPFQPDSLFISFCFLCLPSNPPQPLTLYLPTHPHLPLLPVLPVLPKTQAQTATTSVAYTPMPPPPKSPSAPTPTPSILVASMPKHTKPMSHLYRAMWFHPKQGCLRQQKGPTACCNSQGRAAHSWLQCHRPALPLLAVDPSASVTCRPSSLSTSHLI